MAVVRPVMMPPWTLDSSCDLELDFKPRRWESFACPRIKAVLSFAFAAE